ncbi:putative bifunctional diguanylate cyclase/phosphodiesterase [Blastococcus sp. VKM Ac-2987]|uniref:putative bifunctional diguanylate cyclase/phosphodiesterase n=1 Tax=Blastococcus sp. VKM Ac-2987 TaxID=3004141 RepID=UPI0022ABB163|nr:bifunctional diguanylate cyclase/phosphodiesterase [Blastococcus sp. VKM Ac-2987]MCZ2858526.1 bifunctional diguanylate cyclase/phosphodiesterase [Blastococcus sp. VKM Ac-2987]
MDEATPLAGTSTITTRLLLRVVAARGGEGAVERVLDRAGLADRRTLLLSLRGRVSYPEKLRLFDAAAEELGDPRIGLALGDAAMSDPAVVALRRLLTTFGTPAGLLRQVSRVSTRLDTSAVFRCESAADGTARLAWRVLPPHSPGRVDCDYNIGMLRKAPVLFGLPPAVVEHWTCQVDGAPQCEYTVTWQEQQTSSWWRGRGRRRPTAGNTVHMPVADAEQRLQDLQEAATDLLSADSLEDTLDRVAERADRAVHAPGYVLDVRLPHGKRHVRSRGLGSSVLAALGDARLEVGCRQVGGTTVLSVPVTSATRDYGVLAVVAWPGQDTLPGDVELLTAYARHAAAAIEMTATLAEAREQEETARLLLTVARSLAGRREAQQIAQTIADAVPNLCDADRAAVALWDAESESVWIAGLSGWPPDLADRAAGFVTSTDDSPELCELIAVGAPMLVDRSSSSWADEVLRVFGVTAMGGVPIKVDDRLVGIVLAYWAHSRPPAALGEGTTERLWGLAGLAGVALDNTHLLDEIRHRAAHDPLTGLPNRGLLHARMQTALSRPDGPAARTALLFCDVRRLKRVNDSLGHGAGDEVLAEVAHRLRSAVRDHDTVARFSGDEFAVLLPGTTEPGAREVADRIHRLLAAPVRTGDDEVFVELAIGVAVAESSEHVTDDAVRDMAQGLLERAEEDMHRRKAGSQGPPEQRVREHLRLETDLHGAIGRGEIVVHLQSQVDLVSGQVVAVEALARWQHPTLGPVPPDIFIPLAEASGQIRDIGDHVLREACGTVAAWRADGLDLEVAVNVSAVQLTDPDFAGSVLHLLAETGLPARSLTLEVTESQVLTEVATRHGHLEHLRALGVGISVDDFGTGYSSLAQLQRLPVTELKIDRSFTSQLTDTAPSSPLIAGIIGLARGLGLRIVAEGVETSAQAEALQEMTCDRVQGYLFGRPADPAAVRDVLLAETSAVALPVPR